MIQHTMQHSSGVSISSVKPSVNVDTTPASSQPGSSHDGLSAASLLAYEQKAEQCHQSLIKKSKYCCTLLYSRGSRNQETDLQKSMQDLITRWTAFEKSDSRYNYGIGDESIYLPHRGDSKPDIKKIKRQFAEYLSEPGHTTLPTFEQAMADTRDSGSAYNNLGVALHNGSRYRECLRTSGKRIGSGGRIWRRKRLRVRSRMEKNVESRDRCRQLSLTSRALDLTLPMTYSLNDQ